MMSEKLATCDVHEAHTKYKTALVTYRDTKRKMWALFCVHCMHIMELRYKRGLDFLRKEKGISKYGRTPV